MKPTERILEVDSTLTGERVGMGIDESALHHIMSALTDLYSDPELAVIREYSTNALDAHRDAGNPLPIEVTLPTTLAPFFRVRDYGDGLDADGGKGLRAARPPASTTGARGLDTARKPARDVAVDAGSIPAASTWLRASPGGGARASL